MHALTPLLSASHGPTLGQAPGGTPCAEYEIRVVGDGTLFPIASVTRYGQSSAGLPVQLNTWLTKGVICVWPDAVVMLVAELREEVLRVAQAASKATPNAPA